MAKGTVKPLNSRGKMRPALSPENRESQLIALAMDRAEQQLIDGTASSQVITHFLKLGTAKAELENEKLKKENAMLEAKKKSYDSAEETKELYDKVIRALKDYGGHGDDADYEQY